MAAASREFDSETSLYYYRARYYDPTTGRFASEDLIGFRGGANFCAYVGNNPPLLVDPTGKSPWSFITCPLCNWYKEEELRENFATDNTILKINAKNMPSLRSCDAGIDELFEIDRLEQSNLLIDGDLLAQDLTDLAGQIPEILGKTFDEAAKIARECEIPTTRK